MNLISIAKTLLAGVLVCVALTAAADNNSDATANADLFGKCQFSLEVTKNLSLTRSYGSSEDSLCSVKVDRKKGSPTNLSSSFMIFSRKNIEKEFLEENGDEIGFKRGANGDLSFKGEDILISSRILKTSLKKEQNGDEVLLVGYQWVQGYIAQGGPMVVPGIRILRITPGFAVSVSWDFQPIYYEKQTKGYKEWREAVSAELIEMVKSVKATPGVAGPTVENKTP